MNVTLFHCRSDQSKTKTHQSSTTVQQYNIKNNFLLWWYIDLVSHYYIIQYFNEKRIFQINRYLIFDIVLRLFHVYFQFNSLKYYRKNMSIQELMNRLSSSCIPSFYFWLRRLMRYSKYAVEG